MRLTLFDLLFLIACLIAGDFVVSTCASDYKGARFLVGLGIYIAAGCPVYRLLKWWPMLLPRCACCEERQEGFHINGNYPRIVFKCRMCQGEFVVWFNGKISKDEAWERPVIILKWPYVIGRYCKVAKPQGVAHDSPPCSNVKAEHEKYTASLPGDCCRGESIFFSIEDGLFL